MGAAAAMIPLAARVIHRMPGDILVDTLYWICGFWWRISRAAEAAVTTFRQAKEETRRN